MPTITDTQFNTLMDSVYGIAQALNQLTHKEIVVGSDGNKVTLKLDLKSDRLYIYEKDDTHRTDLPILFIDSDGVHIQQSRKGIMERDVNRNVMVKYR